MELKEKALAMMDAATVDESTPASRHPVGRGSALSESEKEDIRLMALVEGVNVSEISRRTGRTRETVGLVLKDSATDELRKEIRQWKRERAKETLSSYVDVAAEEWTKAIPKAAKRGDHKPARDLLMHEDVIKPLNALGAGQVVVNVGVFSPSDIVIGVPPGQSDAGVIVVPSRPSDEPVPAEPKSSPILGARLARYEERERERGGRPSTLWRGSGNYEQEDDDESPTVITRVWQNSHTDE